jgi:predicted component of type VI protein secretion system
MLQLQILSGKQAGVLWDTRRFPVRIGRAPDCDLRVEDDGVWDAHLRLELKPDDGFTLTPQPGALVSVNQSPVETARLRNGDIITLGSVKIAFRLSPTKQTGLKLREAFVWFVIVAITVSQCALLACLLR